MSPLHTAGLRFEELWIKDWNSSFPTTDPVSEPSIASSGWQCDTTSILFPAFGANLTSQGFLGWKNNCSPSILNLFNTTQSTVEESNEASPQDIFAGLISGPLYLAFEMVNGMSCVGIATNILSCVVFACMGLKDGITVSFFLLGVSDLLCMTLVFAKFVTNLLVWFRLMLPNVVLEMVYIALRPLIYQITILVNVSVSVQRCLCVAKPIKFRNVSTPRLNIIIFSCICLFEVAIHIPYFVSTGIDNFFPTEGAFMVYTRVILVVFGSIILPFVCYCIVLACMVILIVAFKRSTQFRKKANAGVNTAAAGQRGQEQRDQSQRVSSKENKLVKCVATICAIFVVSNLFFILLIVYMFYRDMQGTLGQLDLAVIVLTGLEQVGRVTGSSTNFFVYCRFNSRFRSTLAGLFCSIASRPQRGSS